MSSICIAGPKSRRLNNEAAYHANVFIPLGEFPGPGVAMYAASKAFLSSFAQASEGRGRGPLALCR